MNIDKLLGNFERVPIALIDRDDNRRPLDPNHVKDLQRLIQSGGLINPITLYHLPDRARYKLLAGRHRLYAVVGLGLDIISARIYDYELNDFELKAVEVWENIGRKNLTPAEHDQQVAELHTLLQRINGPAVHGGKGSGHRMIDTARLLGKSVGSIAGSIKIDKLIKALPELGLEKMNRVTALRTAKRLATVLGNQAVADSGVLHNLADSYIVGDFFNNELPSESFAMIECDPPYGIDIASMRLTTYKDTFIDYTEVPAEDYIGFLNHLCTECYRLATPNAWIVLWSGPQWYQSCTKALNDSGWHAVIMPGIWKKGNSSGQAQAPDFVLGNSYEAFIYARKGSPNLHKPGRSNIFDYIGVPPSSHRHPTERPVFLIQDLIDTFCWPSTNILCPFLGSGNTIIAANNLGLQCTGFDLSEAYRNEFLARIKGE